MWPLMIVLLLANLASATVMCPDGRSCPDQSRCCKHESGNYGCCPAEKTARCDTMCSPREDSGDSSPSSMALEYNSISVEGKTLEMETGAPSGSVKSDSFIIHCDATHYCSDGYRCCHMQSGGWSCCPYLTTVCCFGGTKCCPSNYVGDISPSSMALEYNTIAVESKTLEMETQALSTSVSIDRSVIYCDSVHYCRDGDTCCRSQSGVWSCCPYPGAVCCKGGVHCCPHGSKCDLQRSRCIMDSHSIPWLTKIPAQIGSEALQNSVSNEDSLVYCDETHVCKAGSTCCKNWHKEWECCPYPKAHCCWDGLHCCPRFHYCDTKRNICKRIFHGNNWIQLSSVKNAEESEKM
ncbi:granulin 1 [Mustelus asterias]